MVPVVLPRFYKAGNSLEIIIDVTKGPAFGNNIYNSVVGNADAVTVDLGFVLP
jgi:hypothetical protein